MGKKKKEKAKVVKPISENHKARVQQLVAQMIAIAPSKTDPNGSYTGRPMEHNAVPVQDADDL